MSIDVLVQPLRPVIRVTHLRSIHYFEFENDFVFEGEQHPFWELVYADRGTAIVTAQQREFPLHQGEIVFHKPDEFHALRADRNDPPSVFIVCFPCRSEAMSFFNDRHLTVPTPLRRYIAEIIADSREAFVLQHDTPYSKGLVKRSNVSVGCEQLIQNNLELFLIKLLRFGSFAGIRPAEDVRIDPLVESMLRLLNNNIYGKISMDEMCRELGFSRAYLSSRFKKACGKTITEYLTERKIKEAQYLIRKNQYTLTQISDFLCYDNPHYFCRVFKKCTQMTPKEYKNSVAYRLADTAGGEKTETSSTPERK